MRVFFSDTFELPLPDGHRFPKQKYRLLRERLQSRSTGDLTFCLPDAATDEQLLLVHTPGYLEKLRTGTLTRTEQRHIGFPTSPALLERSRRSTGATLAAARASIEDGAGVHLAGGTHHAFADRGEGFCIFNDVAVACRNLQASSIVDRAVVVDLDVHQGNGTADIFADDPSVFTFSMHAERNYPLVKCEGDLDVALPDDTEDIGYLRQLREALDGLPLDRADIVFYLAGADPFKHDRLGRLSLSKAALSQRDELVFRACLASDVPVTVVMAGGYAEVIDDVVDIHTTTVFNLEKTRA